MKPSPYSRKPHWLTKLACENKAYGALALWDLLASHGKYNKDLNCYDRIYPSYATLAKEMNCGRWYVRQLIKQLKEFDAIDIHINDDYQKHKPNQYTLWCNSPEERNTFEYQLPDNKKRFLSIKENKGLYLVKTS